MAEIAVALSRPTGNARQVLWEEMTNGDTAEPLTVADGLGKVFSVQFVGTWDGATAVLQGSNDASTWFTVNDVHGNAVSTTADAFFEVSTTALYLRPSHSGGSGSEDIDVTMISRS